MTRLIPTLAVLALATTGCVSAKKHKALENQYAQLQDAYMSASIGYAADRAMLETRIDALAQENRGLASYYRSVLDTFGDEMASGEVTVVVYPDRVALQLAEEVTFASGSAELNKKGRKMVDKVAALLKEHPARDFQVEGHTDARPMARSAEFDDNWELGAARSLTMVDALVDAGVTADQLSAASYAATEPLASNDSKKGRQANRRVSIALRPDLDEMPGHHEILWHAARLDAQELTTPERNPTTVTGDRTPDTVTAERGDGSSDADEGSQ